MKKVGSISFLIAMVLALLSTFGVSAVDNYMWLMALLGAVFAVCSLEDDNAMGAIVLALGLSMAATGLNGIPMVGSYIGAFAGQMAAFTSAAALVVALRWLWNAGDVMGLINKA